MFFRKVRKVCTNDGFWYTYARTTNKFFVGPLIFFGALDLNWWEGGGGGGGR
jgi:hypothetical protein